MVELIALLLGTTQALSTDLRCTPVVKCFRHRQECRAVRSSVRHRIRSAMDTAFTRHRLVPTSSTETGDVLSYVAQHAVKHQGARYYYVRFDLRGIPVDGSAATCAAEYQAMLVTSISQAGAYAFMDEVAEDLMNRLRRIIAVNGKS